MLNKTPLELTLKHWKIETFLRKFCILVGMVPFKALFAALAKIGKFATFYRKCPRL